MFIYLQYPFHHPKFIFNFISFMSYLSRLFVVNSCFQNSFPAKAEDVIAEEGVVNPSVASGKCFPDSYSIDRF
jgi:hypothetical protein